ncbi:MAG TPA: ABC transporter permease [Phototrophicaceae bacterium]|nr:ABC transporter permease [Phototrophicaceae bacterium]
MRRRAWLRFFVRRLAIYLLTIFGSFTVAFLFFHLIPGNPIAALMANLQQQYGGHNTASADMIKYYNDQFGIDQPLPVQYVRYITNVVFHQDLGPSLLSFPTHSQDLIMRALPWTIGMLGLAVIISWIVGLLLGGLLGWRRNLPGASLLTSAAIGLAQIPQYIVAIMLVFIFAYGLSWLPSRDAYPANVSPGLTSDFILGVIRHGILPALSIVIVAVSGWVISTRSLIVSILGEDYLLYAQAKGLPRRNIFLQYALRNALLPQLTGLAISLGFIVNGALLVETLFNYPGLGSLLTKAVGILDYNTMQGIVLISIVSVLTANFLLDLFLPLVDPRIRIGA